MFLKFVLYFFLLCMDKTAVSTLHYAFIKCAIGLQAHFKNEPDVPLKLPRGTLTCNE